MKPVVSGRGAAARVARLEAQVGAQASSLGVTVVRFDPTPERIGSMLTTLWRIALVNGASPGSWGLPTPDDVGALPHPTDPWDRDAWTSYEHGPPYSRVEVVTSR